MAALKLSLSNLNINPVLVKELRSRMRGRRTVIFLTLYLLFLAGMVSLIYLAFTSLRREFSITSAQDTGLAIFYSILIVQIFLVIIVSPALTTGSITSEKEHQTFDLIRTTTLTARSLILGKLLSALSFILILIITTIPLQSLVFLLGGISIEEFFISQLLILASAVSFSMFGIFSSAFARSTLMANVIAFGGVVLFVFILPLISLLLLAILAPNFLLAQSPVWLREAILTYGGLLLAGTNLPSALIVSKMLLSSENSFLLFSQNFGGHEVWFVSPWPIFILFSILITLVLFWASVRRVRRTANA